MNHTQKGVCLSTQKKSNKAEKTEQEFVEREREIEREGNLLRNAKRRDVDVGDMELVGNGRVGGVAEIRREKRNVDEETEEKEHKRRRKRRQRHRHIPKLQGIK